MNELFFTKLQILGGVPNALFAFFMTLLCGMIVAVVYWLGANKPSKFMVISLIMIPVIVQVVIMMVNGSIGAGVAATGAFSLIRFRSAQGTSRDISMLFFCMAAGLVAGMGFVSYALFFTVILAIVVIFLEKVLAMREGCGMSQLKIMIPEDMDYRGVFDEILKGYTTSNKLVSVRTIRMGTMYELDYQIRMKKDASEKEMIDKLRCRNGNLTISLGVVPDQIEVL
jgi:hypothetical protein